MDKKELLQSKIWEDFQISATKEVIRINGDLAIVNKIPVFGSYLFFPKGPQTVDDDFIDKIKKQLKKTDVFFIRIEPENIEKTKTKLHKIPDVHPSHTIKIDLHQTTEEIFESFKPKTRYNIRLAEKKGVIIEKTTNPVNIKIFTDILKETNERDGIRSHPKEYYKKMIETLGKNDNACLYLARYNNQYIASAIITFYADTATYLHGASSNDYRNVMAPYLLQWQAIKDSAKKGYIFYDFFGIADTDDPNHPWSGITRFKKGFGGEIYIRPGTFDIPISRVKYYLYKIIKKFLKWTRKIVR